MAATGKKRSQNGVLRNITLSTLALLAVASSGCYGVNYGYNLGFLGFPMPVSPYYQHKQEEKFWKQERYNRVPILGPTTSGGPTVALDPPSDDEIMHALETARPVQGGIPLLWEKQRNNVRIIKEKIADYMDPPRFYPLMVPLCCTMHTTSARFTWMKRRSSVAQCHKLKIAKQLKLSILTTTTSTWWDIDRIRLVL